MIGTAYRKKDNFSLTNTPKLASSDKMFSFPGFNSKRNSSLRTAVSKHLSALVFLLFLCSQLHSVIHHHDDLDDHPDCSICAVAHHQSGDSTIPSPYIIPAPIINQAIFFFTVVLIASSAPTTYPSRAPPF
jgi:hypothetical protein